MNKQEIKSQRQEMCSYHVMRGLLERQKDKAGQSIEATYFTQMIEVLDLACAISMGNNQDNKEDKIYEILS